MNSVGKVTALTVITPIIPERLEALRAVLASIQQNPGDSIAKISTIHYARWVILDNGANLLFTSNFDGTWESYLRDFVREIPGGLDAIWGHCVGYPGAVPFEPFAEYVRQHDYDNDCFYVAYPEITVPDVLAGAKWKKAGEALAPSLQQFLIDTA